MEIRRRTKECYFRIRDIYRIDDYRLTKTRFRYFWEKMWMTSWIEEVKKDSERNNLK